MSDSIASTGASEHLTPAGRTFRWLPWPSADDLKTHPPLVVPLMWVAAMTAVGAAGSLPLVRAAYAGQPAVLTTATTGIWVLAVLSPVLALLKGVVFGAAMWATLVLLGADARYKAVLSVAAYGEIVWALQGAWMVALVWMRGGSGAVSAPEDLAVSTGLDAFVSDPASPLAALLRTISPFHVLWILVLTGGLGVVARTSRWRAGTAAMVAWCFLVVLGVTRAWLS